MITLRQPTLAECQLVREWRNDPAVLPMLRTGYKTEAEQEAFYRDVICNAWADHWYFAIDLWGDFYAFGGLTHLSRVAGQAEISLIVDPEQRGCGLGKYAVEGLLAEARKRGLTSVIGECYATGNLPFWARQIVRRPARMTWEWTL